MRGGAWLAAWWVLAGVLARPAAAGTGTHGVAAGSAVDGSLNDVGPLPEDGDAPLAAWGGPPPWVTAWARWQARNVLRQGLDLDLAYDTTGARGEVRVRGVGAEMLQLGAFGGAELLLAGAQHVWIRDGVNHPGRGFGTSQAHAGARAGLAWPGGIVMQAEVAARGWGFTRLPWTDPDLRLPEPFVAAEPRLRAEWAQLTEDPGGLGLLHGLRGTAEVGADLRMFNRPWGGLQGEKPDPRNNVGMGNVPRRFRLDGALGFNALRIFHVHAAGQGGLGVDEDDVSRTRVGGMSGRGVDLPGAAWGEYVVDRWAVARAGLGVRPHRRLYAGATAHLVVVNDPRRDGHADALRLVRALSAGVRVGLWGWGLARLEVGGSWDVRRPRGHGALGATMSLEVGAPP
ncbi:MAG: hypothetical protein HY904_01640 [Deltaproteobacteria bacterium]|nr:hypothetical protein [Deltaproteobacteria bacterium]